MKKFLVTLVLAAVAVPAVGKDPEVVHIRDPFEACEKVAEQIMFGLSSLKCSNTSKATEATWIVSFDLGKWDAPYSRFTVEGGRELTTVRSPQVSVTSCRRGCNFSQVASINIPFDLLFSWEAMNRGLVIKAVGGPRDLYLELPASRVQAFRDGLIKANFIEEDGNPSRWNREFKWPQPKREDGAPDGE